VEVVRQGEFLEMLEISFHQQPISTFSELVRNNTDYRHRRITRPVDGGGERTPEKVIHLFTWMLFLDIVGHYSLIQRSRAWGAARRRAGRVVGVVRLIVRGMWGRRTWRTSRRYTLLAKGWTGSAASPGSPAAATAIWHTADSWWAGDHAAASASTTPPGTCRRSNSFHIHFGPANYRRSSVRSFGNSMSRVYMRYYTYIITQYMNKLLLIIYY